MKIVKNNTGSKVDSKRRLKNIFFSATPESSSLKEQLEITTLNEITHVNVNSDIFNPKSTILVYGQLSHNIGYFSPPICYRLHLKYP